MASATDTRNHESRRRWHPAAIAASALLAACGSDGAGDSGTPPPPPPPPPPVGETCYANVTEIDDGIGCLKVSFDIASGEPEVYEALITAPPELAFDGFLAAGPAGTAIGTIGIDIDVDGADDVALMLVSLGDDAAYADMIADSQFTPALEPLVEVGPGGRIAIRLPYGGDGDPTTFIAPLSTRISLRVREEAFTASAALGATFMVDAEITSVDPETDDYDDGMGAAPTVTTIAATVTIVD